MNRKAVSGVMLFLTFILSTVLITPAAGIESYPFEDVFENDLLDIANSVPQIEAIYIKSWSDFRPTGHLWASIRISYISGLSSNEKIEIQDYVQHLLESKWYIDSVERNGIITTGAPPPWPGFVIGDLSVGFKSTMSAVIEFENLNSTYYELLDDYDQLQQNYSSLQKNFENLTSELNNIRNAMYAFIATTIILMATTLYFATKKPKVKPESKAT